MEKTFAASRVKKPSRRRGWKNPCETTSSGGRVVAVAAEDDESFPTRGRCEWSRGEASRRGRRGRPASRRPSARRAGRRAGERRGADRVKDERAENIRARASEARGEVVRQRVRERRAGFGGLTAAEAWAIAFLLERTFLAKRCSSSRASPARTARRGRANPRGSDAYQSSHP